VGSTSSEAASNSERAGFFSNALELTGALWAYLRSRLELASLEGREAVGHWLKAFGLLVGGLTVMAFGYLLFCLAIVFAIAMALGGGMAWVWVTLGLALLHFIVGAVVLAKVRGLARAPAFTATLEEFKKDQAWLETKTGRQN
jgi:uncharacterized membrane protein YqjE